MAQKQVKRRWSYKEDRRLLALAAESRSLEVISDQLKRPAETVLTIARRLGVTIKPRGANAAELSRGRKHRASMLPE
ncbi:MAG: hypothetical protein E7813_09470 [Bradyrhizobium sp.]|nr:MAG: hypothetical protein E7813_09470 [Bradyrhizobium sp.]